MWINGIQVTGAYGFSYEFGAVNVLLGENGSGKSTFVKLILYALGAQIHNFIDEIAKFQFCDYVHIDFTTKSNNRFLVIRKLPDMNQVTIMPYDDKGILHQDQVSILNLDEYSDFLLEEEKYEKSVINYGQNKTATLTYRQLLRAGLVDQYTPHNRILADVIGGNNDFMNSQVILCTAIIEKILDTLDQELQRLRLEHKQKKKEYLDIRNQILFYQNIREEFSLNSDTVLNKIEKIDTEIATIKEEKHSLSNFKYEQLNEIEKVNNKASSKIVSDLRLQTNKYKDELTQLEFELKDLKKTKKSFEKELEDVKKQLASRQVLLTIPVTICPICFSELNLDKQIEFCPNCSHIKTQEKIDSVANYKRMLEESITEVKALIDSDKNKTTIIKKNLNIVQKELSEKESQYLHELGNIQEPINNIVNQIQKRLQVLTDRTYKLNESKQTLIKLNKLDSKKNALSKEIKSLEEDIQLQENKTADEQLLFIKFQEKYKELFVHIYGEEHEISIGKESYMPIIDGTNIMHSNHSESIKVVAHLAYILNLFLFNQYTDEFKINNLGFVILDSPRDKDLDIDKYERLLDLMKNQSSGQLFLTGSLKEQAVYKRHFEENTFLNSLVYAEKLLKKLD